MQETQVRSLGREDPLEKEMATHFNIFAWGIPWTEEPGGLQSMGSQRIRHGWAISTTVALSVAQRKTGSSHSASWLTSAAQRLNSLKREYCCSVSKSGPTLCDPMDCTTPGLPVSYHLPEFARVHVLESVTPSRGYTSSYVTLFFFCPFVQSFPASVSFPVSRLFASGGQISGASALASVLPMSIQG